MGSNPILGSRKVDFFNDSQHFFADDSKVWQSVAQQYEYKLCRLIHHEYDLSKRWYVIFYAWNVAKERLQRKRIFDPINREKSIAKRLEIAEEIIRITNTDLRNGKVLGKQQLRSQTQKEGFKIIKLTLLEGIKYFIEKKRDEKKRITYLRRFATLMANLNEFYEQNHWPDINIRSVDIDFVRQFMDFLRPRCKSNKTFNNYRADLGTVLNFLKKKAKPFPLFRENPVDDIDKLRVIAKKHAAFNDVQMREIINAVDEAGYQQLKLFIQFMYYTLARPIELLAMRIRDIELENNRIVIHGEDAKNWRDEYVTLSPRFKEIIEQAGILNHAPSNYIFGYYLVPGSDPHPNQGYFGKRMKKILEALGYLEKNPNYSLYGVKHSGAIALYLATLDIFAVKEQCRHTTIQQTNDYLRDLGVIRQESPVMKWQGAI